MHSLPPPLPPQGDDLTTAPKLKGSLSLLLGASPLAALCALWMYLLPEASTPLVPDGLFEHAWARGALISELPSAGQWWRLWSAPLAHASSAHMSANLLTLALCLCVAWRALSWRGARVGLWSSTMVYASAVLCFLLRALYAEGWSGGLSGGVMALMSYVAFDLTRSGHALRWLWGGLCLLYALGIGGEEVDQLTHLIGLALGGLTWLTGQLTSRFSAQRLTYATLALSLAGLWVAWGQLGDLGALWSRWRAYSHIAELGGPALGNGLCFVGQLTPERALEPPWRGGPPAARWVFKDAPALLIYPVSAQASVATLERPSGSGQQMALVCLTPLHLWPESPQRRRWLKVLLTQLESARAHISP